MTDILVIGGGIAGVSVAARLAPHADVTLLEAETALGYHASGRSAALFEENYGKPPVKALNRASRAYHDSGGYLSPRGFLILCETGEDAAFEADMAELACHEITLEEARAHVPILNAKVRRAAYHADALDIDTDRMFQGFASDLRTAGGQIETRARVTSITRQDQGWQVTCGDQTYTAPILVNAAGAWADAIARMAGVTPLGLKPLRRSMARIPAPGGHDVSRWPMFFGPGETWYAKPDAGALIVSPADEDPQEPQDAWADDMVLAEGLDRYQGYVTEPVTRLETSWAGLRTFTPDRLLALGPAADTPSFIWCAGQGGYGFATAPAASQLTADLTLGHSPALDPETVRAFNPARFQ